MLKVQKQEMFLFFFWGDLSEFGATDRIARGFRLQRSCVTTRSEVSASFDTFVAFPVILRVCVLFFFSFEEWKLLKTTKEKSTKVKVEKVLLKY